MTQEHTRLPGTASRALPVREQSLSKLVAVLQSAYSGELAAAYAYRGHWRAISDGDERARIRKIESEEWHHRQLVGEMLTNLNAQPNEFKEIRAATVGRVLGFLCHVSGWLAPMYGAGRLESRNIREYETAARYARDCGKSEFINGLLTMAEVEWDHELYFRSRVLSHTVGRRLNLWPQPPPKETIRLSFEQELVSAIH
jgi:rubrerythrin